MAEETFTCTSKSCVRKNMKITRRQLKRLIREAVGDDLPGGPFEFTRPDFTRPDEGKWGGYSPWLRTTLIELEKKIKNLGVDVDNEDDFNITVDEFSRGEDEAYPGGGGSFSVRWHLSSLDADDLASQEDARHVDAMGKPFSGPGSAPGDLGPLHPDYKKQ